MHLNIILILFTRMSLSSGLRCHECSGNHCRDLSDLGNVTRCKTDVSTNHYLYNQSPRTLCRQSFVCFLWKKLMITRINRFVINIK